MTVGGRPPAATRWGGVATGSLQHCPPASSFHSQEKTYTVGRGLVDPSYLRFLIGKLQEQAGS